MEQNNYLEFEKSKAAVYTIMEACFQYVFDLEDDELGSFHDEIDEYMNQNQKGSWLPENQMITDRFYLCGDGISDVADDIGLVSSRVMICGAHEAHMVLRILSGQFEP